MTKYPESIISSACLDGDGSLYLFDQDQNPLEGWPENWPEWIEDVETFLAAKQIILAVWPLKILPTTSDA